MLSRGEPNFSIQNRPRHNQKPRVQRWDTVGAVIRTTKRWHLLANYPNHRRTIVKRPYLSVERSVKLEWIVPAAARDRAYGPCGRPFFSLDESSRSSSSSMRRRRSLTERHLACSRISSIFLIGDYQIKFTSSAQGVPSRPFAVFGKTQVRSSCASIDPLRCPPRRGMKRADRKSQL
jgi:hypothetical protein